jgi:Rrf2 family transcriptional regulator, cysteine metabolism repressor
MFNFTTTLSYGLRLLLNLARTEGGPKQLKKVSQEEDISLPYLRKIVTHLERADIIKSLRGPGGGFLLKRRPSEISLIELISILTHTKVIGCVKKASNCKRSSNCAVKNLLEEAYAQFQLVFKNKTLATLLNGGSR